MYKQKTTCFIQEQKGEIIKMENILYDLICIYIYYECIQLVLFKYLSYAQEMDAINTKDVIFGCSGSLFFMVKKCAH
jgi:hypothetical protein